MTKGRIYVASALALSLGLGGCAADGADKGRGEIGDDWGDDQKYPQLGGAYSSLLGLVGTCAYDTSTKVVTVTSTDTQTIIIGKRAVDSALMVNGVACSTATTSTLKKIIVNGDAAEDETLVIDFLGGLFAPATSTAGAGGIVIDLGAGGTDSVRIRGTSGKDAFFMGADDSIGFNSDNFKDITMAGHESVAIALASGDDEFSATNPASPTVTKGVMGTSATALTVSGGAGNDKITGGSDDDTLNGGPGNDTLSGGLGADTLNGEAGDDTLAALAVDDGTDDFNCGDNNDTVSYAARSNDITAAINGTGGEGSEADTIDSACENLTGGSGDDTLTGHTAQANILSGGDGDDTLIGLSGNDVLNGGAGDDTFDESTTANGDGNDTFNGGAGTDTVTYASRATAVDVTMDGRTADDGEGAETDDVEADVENVVGSTTAANTIVGNALNNTLTGGGAVDTLSGGDGNDTLIGGALGDTLNGGAGDDTFDEGTASNGGDVFNGGDGVDTVDYGARVAAVTVTMAGATADDGASAGAEGDNVKEDVENCNGGDGVDSITGNAKDNVINGGAGADTLLSGLAGDDFIDGEADSAASIVCGEGDDIAINGTADATCEL